MEFVMPILEGAWRYVLTLRISDYLDIALMAYAIYWLLKLVGTSKVESVGKVILLFLLDKTRPGMAMRAVSRDADAAQLMGIDVNTTISLTFGIGSALAAVGALVWGMKYPQIAPTVGAMPGMKCFISAVIGGIGNVKGAVIGGLLLGFVEVMIVAFFPALTSYRDAFAFCFLIVVLLVKPTGIVGEKIADKV